jgi:hypothetical protein
MLFRVIDTNKNGTIEKDEFAVVWRTLYAPKPEGELEAAEWEANVDS